MIKVFITILTIIICIILSVLLFMKIWPSFGKKPSKKMQESYANKTKYFYDGKFHNIKEFPLTVKVEGRTMIKELFSKDNNKKPDEKIPVIKHSKVNKSKIEEMKVMWFGHSTVLLQMHGMNILADPVLGLRSSPLTFIGPRRMADVPIKAENLPELDIVLVSHSHYDHLDYETINKIDSKVKKYLVPLGVESILLGWGIDKDKINSLSWYDEEVINGLKIASVPAQHYSSRSINDKDATLWCGFIIRDEYHSFYYTGDTGFGEFFKDIHEKYGDVELMMADSGQYDKMWPYIHMDAGSSLKSAEIMHAKYLIPMHWGSFALANHPWVEPAQNITSKAEESNSNVSIITPRIGEIVDYNNIESYKNKWWESVS